MKYLYTLLLILFLHFFASTNLYATHAAGGELIYELVPNTTNQYKFTFKFYRDCSGVVEPASFTMCYNNTCGVNNQSITLNKLVGNLPNGQPNGSPILQAGCYNQITICQGGTLAGYREWWYTGVVTLNSTCNFWRFWVALCCRNNAIGNVTTPGSQNIFIEANFDNTNGFNFNSSPFVASPPIAYYCVNTPSFAYYTAIDPDGDSLVYESIAPKNNNTGCGTYAPNNIFSAPYTIIEPFPTGNTFVVNPNTGVISFTPTTQGSWVFSIKIKEYRNGQYIGFIMRDIQFVVSVCNLPSPLSVFASFGSILCNGATTTVTGIGNGGIPPYQYNLNGGVYQANNQFVGVGAGTYTITVMDANNCTNSSVFVITQPSPFTVTTNNIVNPVCNMPCTGSAQANAAGGTQNYTYSITAPGVINVNTGAITGLCAGTYTITSTDNNSCTATTVLTVNQPMLGVNISNITNILCFGDCNATAQANNIGGVNPITYSITAPGVINANNGSMNGLCAGTYAVTVTDATMCTGTASFTITQAPVLNATVTNISQLACNGPCNGTAQTNVLGGTPVYTYAITAPGIINATGAISGLCAGNYTVTVTDANLCTTTTTFTVSQPQPIGVNITNITNITCNGLCNGTAQASGNGGVPAYTYTISAPGIINPTGAISGLCAGTYTVTVTDANLCTITSSFTVTQLPALNLNVTNITNILCNGMCNGTAQAIASGGAPNYTYAITAPGSVNATGAMSNLCAGSYTVSVTDANLCTATMTFMITEPQPTSVNISNITNLTCNGFCNGTAQATGVGGTPNYTYSISAPGIINATGAITALCAGSYTVTVTDANLCTATTTFSVVQLPGLTASISNIANVTCNGMCNGTAQTTCVGGAPAYSYSITAPGIINAAGAISNLCVGTYTVTVSDINLCTATTTFTISEPLPISISISNITNITCNGLCNGTAQATGLGGTPSYSYSITSPAIINAGSGAMSGLCAGTYTVSITDANGCTATTLLTLAQPPALTWTQNTATNITCNGGNDGSITTTATGGTGIINYNLQPTNQTNNTGLFTNLAANTYTILATDANGCTISTTLTITEPTLLSITNITNTNPTCVPGNDGSMTITASGGTLAYTYNIGGANQASNVFANLGAGNYTITVTDANGCTATSTQTIAPPNSPTITAVVTTDVDCNGGNNGSITVTATGGLGALNYNLQPVNQNNATGIFTNLAAGVYTMTVADANGCTISSTATIIEPTILSWTSTATTDVNCNGGNDGTLTATATGGTGMINYNLQPTNQTNNTGLFTNLTAGTYTVTATDANGCTLTTTLVINQSPALTWTQNTATNITCNGGIDGSITTTATGGTGIINYNLQPTNQTNNTGLFTNLAANTYTILATDANGCTISTTLTITEPTLLSITNITNTNPTCVPGNDGSMTITASGGTLAYTYNIGGANQANNVFANLGAGNYTITVTDANGCTATSTQTIAPPNSPTITAVVTTDVDCNGGNNGSITVTATGGLGALNYNLQPVNQNNATGIFTNLAAGVYTMTVADANGCSISSTATIIEPTILSWTTTATTDVNCNGGNDGTLTATATGGTGIINYNLQPTNQTNNTGLFTNLTAGTYTVTATDANGCTLTTTLVINQSPALTWTQNTATNITCNGGIDGSITTTATGGTGIINYNLQPTNQTNNTGLFTNLAANTYTILATDANGCTISTTLTITEPTLLSITNITNTNPTCVPGNDGSMTITASGGTLAYTYNIGGANQASNVFANLGAGNYTITVTDANGCTATSTQTIAPPNSPTITAVVTTDVDCNGGNNGSITVTATGGLGALNYNLQPVNQNNATGIFTNLAAGVYTMTVADANGCTISSTATIIEPTILSWTATATTDVNCNGGNDGTLTATATGGTGMINYNLQPTNQTNNTGLFTNLTAGTYTVTATDANGCTLTTTLVINQSPALTWTQNTATNITCNGGIDGSITTTATGGTGIINYNLQPTNQTNNTGLFTNLAANTYTIIATDANGCTISTTLTITEPTLLSITNITTTNPTCVPGNDGSMTITASGGTLAYTYNIGGANQANNVFANLGAGNYTITVTDANGCTATSTQTIAPPNSPTITAVVTTDLACNGGNNGSITITATGGLGALNYNLQPVNQNNATGIFTNLAAGVYTMTVADANGCTSSSTTNINQPIALSWTLINVSNVNCNGATDGAISVLASGGTGTINYQLQPNNINNGTGLFPNLTAGAYTITATDANNCTLTIFLQVTQPTLLNWTTAITTNVTCNGGNDGTLTATATGGIGIINYNLQPTNQNNNTGLFANLTANTYTILATDANGCTISTTLTITEPTLLQITNIAIVLPSCVPGNDGNMTINATGGTGIYTFNIGGANQANNVFNNLGAGNYTITVTDANGCTASSVQTITAPNAPTITSALTTDANCVPGNNGTVSITANGGNGIYTYSADGINYQANNVITGLAAGTYTITVQDAIGCTSSSLITINTTPSPVITNIAVTDATCVPGCDGTATITATGGNGIYTYSIDNINFQANNLFTSVCANVYTATVTDGNGCSVTSTFTVTSANAPTIALNNTVDILCFGGNNGAIAVTANGAGPMTYLLLPNGITNATGLYNNLTAFTYTVQVTDANGCSANTVVLINEPPMLQFTNILNNGALCSGANNGSIDVSTTGGTGNITYGINPFANFVPPTIFNNLMGNTTYTVTATDANGCSVTSSIFISQPQPIVFTSTVVTDVTCNNGSNGSLVVQAIGGTGILNYDLNPNPQNNITGVFNNLTAATYTVTVTDANNCTLTTSLIVAEPTAITINTLTYTDITCSNVNDGTININALGGTGVLTYNLQPLNITNVTGIFNALVANNYTIQITDANGCIVDTTVTIINPLPLLIDSLNISNVLCNGDSNGSIQINVSGGTGLLNYNLLPQNINNGNGLFNNLPINNYTITITDANLCSISTIVIITEPLPLTATVLNIQNILCSGGNNGQIDIGANGGTTPYLFTILPLNINNGTGIFTGLSVGSYTVNVTDSNQCSTSIQPIIITEPVPMIWENVVHEDIKCFGDSTGSILVSASGGTGSIAYTLQPNLGIQNPIGNFTTLVSGVYTVIATDANNCSISTLITIVENPPIVFGPITFVSPRCWNEANGIINMTASGGVGSLTYCLNNQLLLTNTTGFFNQITGGNYIATVTDSLGCIKDTSIILLQPDKLGFSELDLYPVYCKGYSDGKIVATASGGNGGYTYYLRPGLNVNDFGVFNDLHEGIYTLSVKDSLGCQFDTTLAVSPPSGAMDIYITKKDLGCYGTGKEGWAKANLVGGTAPFTYLWSCTPPQFDSIAIDLQYGKYIVEVIDSKGCKDKDSVIIDPGPCCEEVFIPNAFSPNGDGNNDVFKVTTSSGLELIQFEIYDRWGKKIWYTDDFREGWDGNDRGQPSDMNTYYYIFRYKCLTDGENYIKKGDINLVR
ncbi:MAG: gliding motility-associated C-terminal domain-containing protein [Bacteroidetes bacterium]|nr:gliding motility-associated C-terminal domain-containing protein [Bacteroidota bacterium]